MKDIVEHHGAGPGEYGMDTALDVILVMSTHAGKAEGLLLVFTVLNKLSSLERMIIDKIFFYFDIEGVEKAFKGTLGLDGKCGSKIGKVCDLHKTGGDVNEDCTTGKFLVIMFFAMGMWKATLNAAFVQIHRDTMARIEYLIAETTEILWSRFMVGSW
jgi:hypothetical protein